MTNISASEVNQPQSSWSALLSLIDRPQQTFANIVAYPHRKWILPVIIAVVGLLAVIWVSAPVSSELAREQMNQQFTQQGLSPDEIEEASAVAMQFTSPLAVGLTGSIAGLLVMGLVWLIGSAYLYFASTMAGGEVKFGSVFLVVIWATIATSLRNIVQAILTLITGKFPVYTSLAALQVSGDTLTDSANPLIAILSFVDPFWFWYIFLLVVGLAAVTKFSKVKAFLIVAVLAVLSIAVGTIPSLIAAAQAS